LQVLWDEVLKTNPIVSEQVKQVREHKGDFYHFAVTLAKQFTDSFRYKQEKQRPTFKPAKAAWEQVEALIVLVVLYHSGLMIIQIPNIEEYLQGNLSTLSDARNDCVNHMINTVQTEKEW
jgi:ribonuclease HIII